MAATAARSGPDFARWPAQIKAGSKTNHISAFWDFLPTVTEIIGANTPDNIDGISYLPSLTGKGEQAKHEYLYWEFMEKGGRKAVRKGDWVLIRYDMFTPEKTTTELYNTAEDVAQKNNVAEEHPELVKELLEVMETSRTYSEDFKFEPRKR